MSRDDVVLSFGEVGELTEVELANACRRAYLRLVVGAHVGWGKTELARWLAGPYRHLAVSGTASDYDVAPPSINSALRAANDTVNEDRIASILESMRRDVLGVLRELMSPEGASAFTKLALDTELVGREGDLVRPRARARMTLVDRALSLVAVDAITRPEDFEHSLFICDRCHQPVFDVASRPLGICRVHISGVERHDL